MLCYAATITKAIRLETKSLDPNLFLSLISASSDIKTVCGGLRLLIATIQSSPTFGNMFFSGDHGWLVLRNLLPFAYNPLIYALLFSLVSHLNNRMHV